MLTEAQSNFPKYEYTFKVLATYFDSGHIEVQFIPKDQNLISVTHNLPIFANFDADNLGVYLDQFAPHDKWFAQEMILKNEAKLKGAQG